MHIYRLAAFIGVLALPGRVNADASSPDTTPIDHFRHIRQACLINTDCTLLGLGEARTLDSPSKAAEKGEGEDTPGELFVGEVTDQPSIIVQKYVPGESDSAEILSFEAWKEKQFREAVASGLVHEIQEEEPVPSRKVEHDDQATAHPAQPQSEGGQAKEESRKEQPKQKVEDVNSKPNPPNGKQVTNPPHRYNYASPDCSARVISSSSTSQHASSVLHKSKDRYMLTPCNSKEHWVVIELCDEIRIEAVEIGMFEFFSGVVKEVVLSVDALEDDEAEGSDEAEDETPRKGSEWEQVAVFEARNVRGSQMFNLPNPTSFHRFIRLDFPSYYGKEYYCPISSVKAYGMNQMEAFKWESKRNKQREDEWARRQAEEDRKRRLPLPSVSETMSVVQVTPRAHVPSNTVIVEGATATGSSGMPEEAEEARHSAAQTIMVAESPTVTGGTSEQSAPATPTPASADRITSPTPQHTEMSNVDDASQNGNPGDIRREHSAPHDETLSTHAGHDDKKHTTVGVEHVVKQLNDTKSVHKATTSAEGNERTALSTDPPEGQSTAAAASSSTRSASTHSPSSASRQSNVKADSSESIYAFIIRRLNALEGNATLAMMYVEEQSRVNRGLLGQLEKSWSHWRIDQAQQQRLAAEKTVSISCSRSRHVHLETEDYPCCPENCHRGNSRSHAFKNGSARSSLDGNYC